MVNSSLSTATLLVIAMMIPNLKGFSPLLKTRHLAMTTRHSHVEENANDINILWEEEEDEEEDLDFQPKVAKLKSSRWDSLNPRIKERLVKAGQQRAIENKKKRESEHTKKRRMMMYVKEKKREKKRASRITRPIPFDDRTPLSALIPGMEVTGVVISLTRFGAYVDIGTECDGLLHVSQITREVFVEHPRQILTPGEEVLVRVRSRNPEKKKLHLSMLPPELIQYELDEAQTTDRIPIEDLQVDDELWGELRRVTDYGAYVEVGAEVDGFLHFMDHPEWSPGAHPSDLMKSGERVRIWVSDVDLEQRRIKLTANRPSYLPGPRRE